MSFADVDFWVFDLDNTLYPASGPVWDMVGRRMTAFVSRATGLPWDEAEALQEKYLVEHGATLAGMIANHGVDPYEFMDYVHDIDFSVIEPDPELAPLLLRLNGRRVVYTNGANGYARNVIARLGAAHAFEDVFAMEDAELHPKPSRRSFDLLIARYGIDPKRAVMVEDSPRNLETAHALGFRTVLIHPEPASTFPAHVHHASDEVKAFLRSVVDA